MAEFVSVAKAGDVPPGQVSQLKLGDGTQVCLANVDGTFYAIGGDCTHQGGPLGEGVLDGTVVTCPWHGLEFHVPTGQCMAWPEIRLRTYEVTVVDGEIEVAL